ncbi:sulfite exporter TauE/SafE family protein, partial [Aerococcus loyolae]
MIGILYMIIILIANTIGSISGMGGGVIIKPMLDFINIHSPKEISFFSSLAVFTMSIISTRTQIKNNNSFSWNMIFKIAIGSILGGILGQYTYTYLLIMTNNENYITIIQVILTIISLLFSYLHSMNIWENFKLHNTISYLLCGLLLGFLASFLGIGGGPINVSLLMLMFNFPIKRATTYSICIIFFSQLSKLVTFFITSSLIDIDISMIPFIIFAALIGGKLGAVISNKISENKIKYLFK